MSLNKPGTEPSNSTGADATFLLQRSEQLVSFTDPEEKGRSFKELNLEGHTADARLRDWGRKVEEFQDLFVSTPLDALGSDEAIISGRIRRMILFKHQSTRRDVALALRGAALSRNEDADYDLPGEPGANSSSIDIF